MYQASAKLDAEELRHTYRRSCVSLCSNSYYNTVKKDLLLYRLVAPVRPTLLVSVTQPSSQPSYHVTFSLRVPSQPNHPANFEDLYLSTAIIWFLQLVILILK